VNASNGLEPEVPHNLRHEMKLWFTVDGLCQLSQWPGTYLYSWVKKIMCDEFLAQENYALAHLQKLRSGDPSWLDVSPFLLTLPTELFPSLPLYTHTHTRVRVLRNQQMLKNMWKNTEVPCLPTLYMYIALVCGIAKQNGNYIQWNLPLQPPDNFGHLWILDICDSPFKTQYICMHLEPGNVTNFEVWIVATMLWQKDMFWSCKYGHRCLVIGVHRHEG
jgi:hypothetical protein